jgi:hypothetical protein
MNAAPLALNTSALYVHFAVDHFDGTIVGQQLEEVLSEEHDFADTGASIVQNQLA